MLFVMFIFIILVDRFFLLVNLMSYVGYIIEKYVILVFLLNWFYLVFWVLFFFFGIKGLKYNYVLGRKGCGFCWDLKGFYYIYYFLIVMEGFIIFSFMLCFMYFKSF